MCFTLILDVNQPNLVQLRQHLAVDLKWGTRLAHEGACSGIQFFPPASLAGLSLEFEVYFDLQPFRLTRGLPYTRLIAEFPLRLQRHYQCRAYNSSLQSGYTSHIWLLCAANATVGTLRSLPSLTLRVIVVSRYAKHLVGKLSIKNRYTNMRIYGSYFFKRS